MHEMHKMETQIEKIRQEKKHKKTVIVIVETWQTAENTVWKLDEGLTGWTGHTCFCQNVRKNWKCLKDIKIFVLKLIFCVI